MVTFSFLALVTLAAVFSCFELDPDLLVSATRSNTHLAGEELINALTYKRLALKLVGYRSSLLFAETGSECGSSTLSQEFVVTLLDLLGLFGLSRSSSSSGSSGSVCRRDRLGSTPSSIVTFRSGSLRCSFFRLSVLFTLDFRYLASATE